MFVYLQYLSTYLAHEKITSHAKWGNDNETN